MRLVRCRWSKDRLLTLVEVGTCLHGFYLELLHADVNLLLHPQQNDLNLISGLNIGTMDYWIANLSTEGSASWISYLDPLGRRPRD